MKYKIIILFSCLFILSGCIKSDTPHLNITSQPNEVLEAHITDGIKTKTSPQNDDDTSRQKLINEKYPPVAKTVSISADKPEFKFVQKLIEPFEGEDEFFPGYGAAVIEVYEVGTTDKLIDTIKINRIYPGDWGMFYIMDINFDGYKDIVIVVDQQGNQGMYVYNCRTWNNELIKFEGASFPDWGFVSIDAERQLILAAWRNWAASHGWAIWEYIDGTLTKTHECNRDYLDISDNGSDIIYLKEVQLINGETQVIFDGNVTEDELYAHLIYDDLWRLGNENWIEVRQANEIEEN